MAVAVPVPSHIPKELVIDFDMFNPPGGSEDVHLAWRRLQAGPEVFWTPRNGGHWVATRGEDIARIQRDHELFSHGAYTVPRGKDPEDLIPVSIDPPRHTAYRMLINTLLPPRLISDMERDARRLT